MSCCWQVRLHLTHSLSVGPLADKTKYLSQLPASYLLMMYDERKSQVCTSPSRHISWSYYVFFVSFFFSTFSPPPSSISSNSTTPLPSGLTEETDYWSCCSWTTDPHHNPLRGGGCCQAYKQQPDNTGFIWSGSRTLPGKIMNTLPDGPVQITIITEARRKLGEWDESHYNTIEL